MIEHPQPAVVITEEEEELSLMIGPPIVPQ
jgi:hypothetical protein